MAESKKVVLELTGDEALVFFEWLSRENEKHALPVQHEAERRVLFDLEALLEKDLVAPFAEDYDAQLKAARERVVQEE